jgi:hypothetical protein
MDARRGTAVPGGGGAVCWREIATGYRPSAKCMEYRNCFGQTSDRSNTP